MLCGFRFRTEVRHGGLSRPSDVKDIGEGTPSPTRSMRYGSPTISGWFQPPTTGSEAGNGCAKMLGEDNLIVRCHVAEGVNSANGKNESSSAAFDYRWPSETLLGVRSAVLCFWKTLGRLCVRKARSRASSLVADQERFRFCWRDCHPGRIRWPDSTKELRNALFTATPKAFSHTCCERLQPSLARRLRKFTGHRDGVATAAGLFLELER